MYTGKINPLFENRYDAGRQLATQLMDYKGQTSVVLAIPNGGVPIAAKIADVLETELDLVIVRKIPFPLYPEAGFGAVADDGSIIIDDEMIRKEGLTPEQVNDQIGMVTRQVRRRSLLYRRDRQLVSVRGKLAVICDDGLASGYTMLAAVESIRRRRAGRIVVAVPTTSLVALEKVKKVADQVTSLAESNSSCFTVADYYQHWYDIPDNEVIRLLDSRETKHLRKAWNNI